MRLPLLKIQQCAYIAGIDRLGTDSRLARYASRHGLSRDQAGTDGGVAGFHRQ
jgi:hypothetical protein